MFKDHFMFALEHIFVYMFIGKRYPFCIIRIILPTPACFFFLKVNNNNKNFIA